MNEFFSDFKTEAIAIGIACLGAFIKTLKDEIGYRLKRKYGIDLIIDKAVLDVEDKIVTVDSGAEKKNVVLNTVKNELKKQGVNVVKRAIISIFGRLGSSINKSVARNINMPNIPYVR